MFKHAHGHLLPTALVGALFVCVAVGSNAYVRAQTAPPAAPVTAAPASDEFTEKVLPILNGTCMACHSERGSAGGLNLEVFKDPKVAAQRPEIWTKVLEMVTAGKMPPRPVTPLSPEQVATLTGWIERTHGVRVARRADPATVDPGRVTARRLNRAEYNNTIRDLLGVTLKPADEFPVDDSGYGFDNIGDVLTLSPMLMEKYMRAARLVSKAAVFGESYPEKPTLLVKLQPKKDQDDLPATGNVLPFSLRGALYGTYRFPVDAEYELRFRYVNLRVPEGGPAGAAGGRAAGAGRGGRGAGPAGTPQADTPAAAGPAAATPPAATPAPGGPATAAAPAAAPGTGRGRAGGARRELTPEEYAARNERARLTVGPELLVFTVDGQKVHEYAVEGNNDYDYARGESVVRMRLTAGDHTLRISWPGRADAEDPTRFYGRDGRRTLFVDYLDIHGPFKPSTAPPAGFKQIFICGAPGKYTQACARQILDNLVTRAYRRPATGPEVQRLLTLVTQVQRQDSFEEGIRVAIEAILMSPNFLFRVERDQPAARTGDGAYRISDYELASRLSYFLWSSMPDEALFLAASQGKLRDKAVLEAQIKRMLADPKAASLVENFGEQWLNLRLMDRKKPDTQQFRAVDDELLDAMRKETRLFLGAIIQEDRSILDLIDAKFTFLNGPLARYYGIPGVKGEAFTRVELDGEQRSGLVTQASILSISSYATRTSPVLRGKWVLENMLGAAPPPPPDDIPALDAKDLGTAASMRQRLQQHRADPACGACHNQMDPIGFSLENYDAAGAWRTKDGNFEIDNSGTLPDGRQLTGAKGLKQTLRDMSPAFAQHIADRLMTYALGRGLEPGDQPVLQQVTADLARDNYRFSTLVTSIVNSRPFQMRSRVTP